MRKGEGWQRAALGDMWGGGRARRETHINIYEIINIYISIYITSLSYI
jgi:hypothetical protein